MKTITHRIRRSRLLVAGIILAVVGGPAAVLASDRFDDVADDHTFHDDIGWLADAEITLGCDQAGTQFCPDELVTRGQVAALLHRLATNQVVDAGTLEGHTAEELAGIEETVVRFETDATETLHDLDGDGFTVGDFIIERATLVDPESGEPVGEAIEDIRIVGVTEPPSEDDPLGDWELVMDATFALDDGNLTFGGYGTIADFAADGAQFAVRGGTGRYAGARGTATVVLSEVGGEVGPLITFELIR